MLHVLSRFVSMRSCEQGPRALLSMCVVLHAVRVLSGCVDSCYVLFCVSCSFCFSLAACFRVIMFCVNTWLMSSH